MNRSWNLYVQILWNILRQSTGGKGSPEDESMEDNRNEIMTYALKNALLHDGEANIRPVMGKFMGAHPEMRGNVKEIAFFIREIVEEISSMEPARQNELLEELDPGYFSRDRTKIARKSELPPLEESGSGVVMRFAPGPSGPLHIGHTRAVILNDEYVKKYGGKLIIRMEDTNPEKIDPEAYESILEDLEWLGVEHHEVAIQSDRFDIYYTSAEKLIELGKAYVCTCDVEEWREMKERGEACPHRNLSPDVQMLGWKKMLDGTYRQNEASLVIKTDLDHRNPAVRDFVGMRINDEPHPRTGRKYRVYPLYNLSVAIDDHLMNCTHVLRGKDHLNNTIRQEYVYRYLGWKIPFFYHYGWVSMKDDILKTSTIKEGIARGDFGGWDDIRLGTLKAMKKRGISPEAFRKYWKDVGIKPVDVQFSWENLLSYNKAIMEPAAKRFFFVKDPRVMHITGIGKLEGNAPLHPENRGMGMRSTRLKASGGSPIAVLIDAEDAEWIGHRLTSGEQVKIRLKDLCNVIITNRDGDVTTAEYAGNDLAWSKDGAKIIQWVPGDADKNYDCIIHKPDGTMDVGKVEAHVKSASNEVVQFERYGFLMVNVDGGKVEGFFTQK